MPNVTFSIDAKRMPADEDLAELSRDCVELCTQVLEAELKNVHVIFLAVRHGHGHPVFADIRYRVGTPRTPEVMNRFMEALDQAIVRRTGLTARIRCFGYTASTIHARH
ncbi:MULTISPECIES: hypothetical protein [Burkholderia]|uniref:Uncharacterized protein n=1 Tax=Burkholderia contaminans TaxID=488447 RepID=A0A6P3AGS7_9BURK|nr:MULTISPECIES: hypothetical protein [Burkholderia]OXJ26127.1 hypothetical protein CFB82_35530 [Burkholderia sp. HI2714]VWD46367.1 hypothetical protein BCO71033_04979 [Burkholderia contaminans]